MRRNEFAASTNLLQVSCSTVLEYPDGKLGRQDFYAVVGDLTRRIRETRPHVVLTIGPEGGVTAHPDHSMASIFATMAFHWSARSYRYADQLHNGRAAHQPQKLSYASALFTRPHRPPYSRPPTPATIV